MLIKPTAAPKASQLIGDMGIEFRTGRASSAKGTLMSETPVYTLPPEIDFKSRSCILGV